MEKLWDVLVVGGGPAGTEAAHRLASSGAEVLLLEWKSYPRHKPCGGALSVRIGDWIGTQFRPLVRHRVREVRLLCGEGSGFSVSSGDPVAYLVERAEFDAWMADRARRAGAVVQEGARVAGIEILDDRVRVRVGSNEFQARHLIAADGVNSRIARRFGLGAKRARGVAIEGDAYARSLREDAAGIVTLDIKAVPGGYGWVFPKNEHVNIGVAGDWNLLDSPMPFYMAFAKRMLPDGGAADASRHGYLIPVFDGTDTRVAHDRVLATGDAAGLVDPFLGEGIYYAVLSGRFAAEAIIDAGNGADGGTDPAGRYRESVRRRIFPELEAAGRFARFAYNRPEAAFRVLQRRPELVESYLDILLGRSSYIAFWRMLRRTAAFDFLRYSLFPRSGDA